MLRFTEEEREIIHWNAWVCYLQWLNTPSRAIVFRALRRVARLVYQQKMKAMG